MVDVEIIYLLIDAGIFGSGRVEAPFSVLSAVSCCLHNSDIQLMLPWIAQRLSMLPSSRILCSLTIPWAPSIYYPNKPQTLVVHSRIEDLWLPLGTFGAILVTMARGKS